MLMNQDSMREMKAAIISRLADGKLNIAGLSCRRMDIRQKELGRGGSSRFDAADALWKSVVMRLLDRRLAIFMTLERLGFGEAHAVADAILHASLPPGIFLVTGSRREAGSRLRCTGVVD